MTGYPLLGFLVFVGACSWFIGWFINAAQKALDRNIELDADAMRDAMKRWPP